MHVFDDIALKVIDFTLKPPLMTYIGIFTELTGK
nr:MAG TPA: hypothetical protein [Caudoviricetes sp.]